MRYETLCFAHMFGGFHLLLEFTNKKRNWLKRVRVQNVGQLKI